MVSSEQVSRLDRLWGENLVTWTGLIVKGGGCVSGVISSSRPGRKTNCPSELGGVRQERVSSLLVVLDLLEDLTRVQVEDLHIQQTSRQLSSLFPWALHAVLRARDVGGLTWTRPESSPATSRFPSDRISPLRAVSLNRATVLTTLFVRGAYTLTSEDAVTASRCGLVGANWTWVIGAYSLMYVGFLYRRQYRDSFVRDEDGGAGCLSTGAVA